MTRPALRPSAFRPLILLLAAVLLAPAPARATMDEPEARRFIEQLADETITLLRRQHVPSEQVAAEFEVLLKQNFAVDTIARFVLGRYWRLASEQQRNDYLNLFEDMVVQTYARRFGDYSGEQLEVAGSRPAGRQDVLVDTWVVQPQGGPPVSVTWRVRPQEERFRIVDVLVEGVSLAVTQRTEFSAIIQRNGGNIDALLQAMERNIRHGGAV